MRRMHILHIVLVDSNGNEGGRSVGRSVAEAQLRKEIIVDNREDSQTNQKNYILFYNSPPPHARTHTGLLRQKVCTCMFQETHAHAHLSYLEPLKLRS